MQQFADIIKVQINENIRNNKTETYHGETLGDKDGKHRVASRGNTEQTNKDMKENKDYIQTQ